ncbi:MAG: DUF2150 family protein [Methanocalculaceae archaeon]|jgi:hypothetical protein|nr:DUF2150 family protein [Methanocalculaceae archaeon]
MVAKKSSKKAAELEAPTKLFYIFYSQDRWDNWLNILAESDFSSDNDSEEIPEGYHILDKFSDDITLAAIKIIRLYQNDRISLEDARTKLRGVEEIVMEKLPESEIMEIVESMQVSMLVLFASGQKYLNNLYFKNENIKNFVKEGRKIFDNDPKSALDIASSIGATVINGASCCGKYVRETDEPTLFDEWLVEIERIADAVKSLKNFDEEIGDVQ